jgi:hypothetical protein
MSDFAYLSALAAYFDANPQVRTHITREISEKSNECFDEFCKKNGMSEVKELEAVFKALPGGEEKDVEEKEVEEKKRLEKAVADYRDAMVDWKLWQREMDCVDSDGGI